MKKHWFTLAMTLILAVTLALSPLMVSAAELGTEIDGAKVVFENPGLTNGENYNWEGGDPSWVACADGEMTVTAQPGVVGMYYRPNSPYGPKGAFGEGGIAMKLKLDFQAASAGDWGAMLLIRNTGHKSWDATNAVSLYFCKDKVALFQAGNSTPLDIIYKSMDGAYYNVEFITDDVDGGKTDVYVLITDENGNLLQNDGETGKYSMIAEGLDTASLPAGFISLYTNSAELVSYSMKQGEWTYNKSTESGGDDVVPATSTKYPTLSGVAQYNTSEIGIAAPDGLDKYWSPIGGTNYTIDNDQSCISVTQSGTEGFFFGPCSPYGGSLVANVAMALNLNLDFKDGAADFGYMLILKGEQSNPVWALSRGIAMMVFPDAITLTKVVNSETVVLATYHGSLQSGKNYNVEFIAKDHSNGTTDAWIVIKDENGNLLTENEGSEVTLGVTGITGVAGEGYVTMFANGGVISGYRFGTGAFTDTIPATGDMITLIAALMVASGCAFVCLVSGKRK